MFAKRFWHQKLCQLFIVWVLDSGTEIRPIFYKDFMGFCSGAPRKVCAGRRENLARIPCPKSSRAYFFVACALQMRGLLGCPNSNYESARRRGNESVERANSFAPLPCAICRARACLTAVFPLKIFPTRWVGTVRLQASGLQARSDHYLRALAQSKPRFLRARAHSRPCGGDASVLLRQRGSCVYSLSATCAMPPCKLIPSQ